jgi:hypothetical protein
MNRTVSERLGESPGAYEDALFAKWLSTRRIKLAQPGADEQKIPSARPNPSESGRTT